MSKQIPKLEKERDLLIGIGRTISAAKKHSLPVKQVIEFTLAAIMEQYEMRGDMEVTFRNVPAGKAPTSKALADSTFTVRRPEKSISKTTTRTTKPHSTKPPTPKAHAKAPAKAPAKVPAHEAPTLKASNTTATLYKAPAFVAPTNKGPKYELPNFKIRKYKTRDDKAPADDTSAALVGSKPLLENPLLENPRKRKASWESSDRPRQRMAPGAPSPAKR